MLPPEIVRLLVDRLAVYRGLQNAFDAMMYGLPALGVLYGGEVVATRYTTKALSSEEDALPWMCIRNAIVVIRHAQLSENMEAAAINDLMLACLDVLLVNVVDNEPEIFAANDFLLRLAIIYKLPHMTTVFAHRTPFPCEAWMAKECFSINSNDNSPLLRRQHISRYDTMMALLDVYGLPMLEVFGMEKWTHDATAPLSERRATDACFAYIKRNGMLGADYTYDIVVHYFAYLDLVCFTHLATTEHLDLWVTVVLGVGEWPRATCPLGCMHPLLQLCDPERYPLAAKAMANVKGMNIFDIVDSLGHMNMGRITDAWRVGYDRAKWAEAIAASKLVLSKPVRELLESHLAYPDMPTRLRPALPTHKSRRKRARRGGAKRSTRVGNV